MQCRWFTGQWSRVGPWAISKEEWKSIYIAPFIYYVYLKALSKWVSVLVSK